MAENLLTSLAITAVGMGLVFGAIILLWGVLTLITWLTAEKGETPPTSVVPVQPELAPDAELALKRRAAAAAVAAALARSSNMEPHEFPLPGTPLVSAWQAVMRSRMLNKRGPVR
jgi:Na+-transporting methylmalonyl-CoA/oxaloacetate decarboxylase gamma subunit